MPGFLERRLSHLYLAQIDERFQVLDLPRGIAGYDRPHSRQLLLGGQAKHTRGICRVLDTRGCHLHQHQIEKGQDWIARRVLVRMGQGCPVYVIT